MATTAPPAKVTGAMPLPGPLAAALKHSVTPSPVHVEMREVRAAGGACSLRLLCSVTNSSKQQLIGGPRLEEEEEPNHHDMSSLTPSHEQQITEAPGLEVVEEEEEEEEEQEQVEEEKEEEEEEFEESLDGVDLHSHDACRAAILKLLSAVPGTVSLLDPVAGEWYEPVLHAAAEDIVSQMQQVTSGEEMHGYAFDVSLSIQESFKYNKPKALLLACEQAAIPSSQPPKERCAVCMECLPLPSPTDGLPAVCKEKEAFALPSCGHTFHRGCIAAWFEKGSTCPLCRCDMVYCLHDVEKGFGLERDKKRKRDMAS